MHLTQLDYAASILDEGDWSTSDISSSTRGIHTNIRSYSATFIRGRGVYNSGRKIPQVLSTILRL